MHRNWNWELTKISVLNFRSIFAMKQEPGGPATFASIQLAVLTARLKSCFEYSESFWILDMSRFAAWWRHIFRHKYIRHICHRLGCSVSNRPPSNHWDTYGTTPTFNKTFLCTCHSGSWNLWKRIQSENKTRINFCNKNHNFH